MPDERVAGGTLEQKLDVLIRLVALQLIRPEESLASRAVLLSRAGLGPKDIALICGTTPESVSVRLAESRRGRRQAAKKRKSESKKK